MIKVVIFDMDGLLIDSEPIWHMAEFVAFALVDIAMTTELCLETTGLRADEVVEYRYRQFPWQKYSKKEIEDRMIDEVIKGIWQSGEAKEGVQEALSFVRSLGVKCALASSSKYKIIHASIEKLAINSYFDLIYSAEEEEYGKPHPGVYISTAKRLQVRPEECLALEDSLNGVIAAKAAKMKCIAIPEINARNDQRFSLANVQLNSLLEFDQSVWQSLNR